MKQTAEAFLDLKTPAFYNSLAPEAKEEGVGEKGSEDRRTEKQNQFKHGRENRRGRCTSAIAV